MSSNILVRLSRAPEGQNSFASSPSGQVDGLVSRFTEEATNPKTLTALFGSSLAYQYARLGLLSMAESAGGFMAPLVRGSSYVTGFTAEVTAYEGLQRSFTTLSQDNSNPNLWNWSGTGGWAQGLANSGVTFSTLKFAGALGREQNLVVQHLFQSGAMVGGQQLAFLTGIASGPQGSLGEQLLHAEAVNLQIGAGMGLVSQVTPGMTALQKSLDLSLSQKTGGFENDGLFSTWALAMAGGPGLPETKDSEAKGPIVLMSKIKGDDGSNQNPPSSPSGGKNESIPSEGEIKRPALEVIEGGAGKKSHQADELRNYFFNISAKTSSTHFRQSLEALNSLIVETSKQDPSQNSTNIDKTLVALHRTIQGELPQLSRAEWTTISAAFLVLGSHIVREGPQLYQATRLAQLMGDLAHSTAQHKDLENDPDLFFRDRLMAQTLVSLKGWLNDEALTLSQKEALSSLFVRMSFARGSLEWPKLGIQMPNVDSALAELGYQRAELRRIPLRTSRAYLDTVRTWRGDPLGGLEYSLAFYLDHWTSDHREAAAGAFEYFPDHEAIAQLRRDLGVYPLNEEAREMALHRMIDLTALHTPDALIETGLAHFLKRSMETYGSGGPGSSSGSSSSQGPTPKPEKANTKSNHFTVEAKGEGRPVTIFANDRIPISAMAIRQAQGMAALPGVVRALGMPDMHAGSQVPNGFVLATKGTIVPGAVGRDINCGMRLYRTGLNRQSTDLRELLENIAARINLGKRWGSMPLTEADVEKVLQFGVKALDDMSEETRAKNPAWELVTTEYLEKEIPRIEEEGSLFGDVKSVARSHRQMGRTQLGTVGDGNHFVEFQVVDEVLNPEAAAAMGIQRGDILMMIHTGSRGLGHSVGTQYMHIAQSLAKNSATPVKDIYAIPADSPEGQNYFGAMNAAANYAFANRLLLGALATRSILDLHPDTSVDLIYDVAHNIVKLENHEEGPLYVHRKGATRAFPPSRMEGTPFATLGQPVLIPGSMGTASYLLVGNEGSEASLHSVNHGAGRVMSRSEALHRQEVKKGKKDRFEGGTETSPEAISDKEFKKAMRGIELLYNDGRTIKGEAPQVYKDIDDVMGVVFSEGLATGVARLKPIAVIKE